MVEHTHVERVDGCFRCELGADEAAVSGPGRSYIEVRDEMLAEYGLDELPPAFLCRYDGAVHKRGIWHEGDTPLVPAKKVEPTEPRCAGCGWTKYVHAMAIERMVASSHKWEPKEEGK